MKLYCPYNRTWSFLLFAGISHCQSTLEACFNLTAQVRIRGCYNFHSAKAECFAVLHTLCGNLGSLAAWKLWKLGNCVF